MNKKHKKEAMKSPDLIVEPAVASILIELKKARKKHTRMASPHEGISTIRKEFEELWEHVKKDTGTSPAARKEAVQLAAMAIRYIEDVVDSRPIKFAFNLFGDER